MNNKKHNKILYEKKILYEMLYLKIKISIFLNS